MPTLTRRLAELESQMAAPDFWDNRERAQKNVAEVSSIRNKINPLTALEIGRAHV